jgi:NAD-dependent deacetylase
MKLATPKAFAQDPKAVQAFYDAWRQNLIAAQPNAAHAALACLERGLEAQGGETLARTDTLRPEGEG